ncbi:hypothetical protein [Nocardioides lijunqiniae]|uniref:hypothetical protein n=1 Tax=Nocardioides lijunqiniae TaxID=2760832 RepID=UPI001877C329|nr:hypothetical protein [Nocardioides lijunqiniae]
MPARRSRAAATVATAVAALALLLWPSPAQAHPFGPPQTVSIELAEDAGVVRVHWQPGAPDDYSYLAAGVGLTDADESQGAGGLIAVKRDADALTSSPLLARYLTRHVVVREATGAACAPTVLPVEHLVSDGVRLEFRCAGPLDDVDVRVSLLTDLHPAYQTMATGPHGQRFAYSATKTEHRWSTSPEKADDALAESAALQLSGVLAGLAAVGGAAALVVRRSRRRTVS